MLTYYNNFITCDEYTYSYIIMYIDPIVVIYTKLRLFPIGIPKNFIFAYIKYTRHDAGMI